MLIPGCGTDDEVLQFFRTAGFEVTAIDFSAVAVAQTRKALGNFDGQIICGDFFKFDFQNRFDLIYERTFLCALHPRSWPKYAKRVAQLLQQRGKLAGVFFYGKQADPPPYPLTPAKATDLFGKNFSLIKTLPVTDSLPLFAGNERWQEWVLN